MPSPNEILSELKKIKYPGFSRDIVSFGMIKDIEVAHSGVTVMLTVASAKPEVIQKIVADVKTAVSAMRDVPAVEVLSSPPQPRRVPRPAPRSAR